MSTTGATETQIEAAIQAKLAAWGIPENQRNDKWTDYRLATEQVAAVVSHLVPSGKVIASAADVAKVPTADELAAMRWISAYPFSRSEVASKCRAVFSAYLERVTE